MTHYTDILAALEEAQYLADVSGEAYALVDAGNERIHVVALRRHSGIPLEVCRPGGGQ